MKSTNRNKLTKLTKVCSNNTYVMQNPNLFTYLLLIRKKYNCVQDLKKLWLTDLPYESIWSVIKYQSTSADSDREFKHEV